MKFVTLASNVQIIFKITWQSGSVLETNTKAITTKANHNMTTDTAITNTLTNTLANNNLKLNLKLCKLKKQTR